MQTDYYSQPRPDVLALVPEDARRILDIGCGTGALGAALKARQECFVVGIERDEQAACRAADAADRCYYGDVEEPGFASWSDYWDVGRSYDCIICADVLEHLQDPEGLLSTIAENWLAPGGTLVVSVPNARNWRVVESLLRGDFSYQDAGLLDRTHLRFFTRRELEKMLYRAGFEVTQLTATPDPGGMAPLLSCGVNEGRLYVACESPQEAQEFYHYQYLATARRAAPAPGCPVSIIIPVWNQLAYTKLCLDSLRRSTRVPYDVIVIDNASDDGAAEYLDELFEEWPQLSIEHNEQNLGWVKACNQGIAAARGETVVLLNNDTVLPTGWLEPLLAALWGPESEPRVGLAGPLSNEVSGPQRTPVGYDRMSALDGWAWDAMRARAGQVVDFPRLVGFCLAARRDCLAEIGGLDERFGMGLYDDDDICIRAQKADWRTVIAAGSFVHHFGGVSFAAAGHDVAAMQEQNRKVFEAKHGADHA